jgi:protein-S-isoprenylcysteine O-methyltransferase Ste14
MTRAAINPENALFAVWAFWAVSWFAAALWSNRTVGRPAAGSEFFYRILTIVGAVLLFGIVERDPRSPYILWIAGPALSWSMVGLAVLGFLFAWWARLHLGRLWSASVTKKSDHRVVDTGPYGLVRHPIYTGIIAASIAVVVVRGSVFALAGAGLMTLGWYIKARLEERFLRQELGAADYDAYAARVPMLVPFV